MSRFTRALLAPEARRLSHAAVPNGSQDPGVRPRLRVLHRDQSGGVAEVLRRLRSPLQPERVGSSVRGEKRLRTARIAFAHGERWRGIRALGQAMRLNSRLGTDMPERMLNRVRRPLFPMAT